jgi:glycosyltransferase involved in cell wall biosynthesis
MRILFLCHYFPPEVNAPASRTYENAKRWVKAGHEVTVITCAPNAPRGEVFPGYRNAFRRVERVDGIKVVRVWSYIAANKGTWRRILNYLTYMVSAVLAAQLERRPDILIATSPQFFCGWAGVLVHWLRRWPFVLEIRDIWPESITTVGAMKKGAAIRFLEGMELRMYAAARHIVAVGQGYRDNLLSKGVPPGKVSVIYNGVDLDVFKPVTKDPEFLRRHGLEGFKVCGYIGTVGMAHGLEIMLKAAEACRAEPWKFLIVGDGARCDELREEASRKQLDNVVFTGRLPKEAMPKAWSSLDVCLIHLKKSELFQTVIPSKMFEAMGMEVPILMGVEGEALDMVREAGAGIPVEPDNPQSLLEGCRRIFAEGGERFGKAGREFVTRRFDRDRLAADYLEVLREKGLRKTRSSLAPGSSTPVEAR